MYSKRQFLIASSHSISCAARAARSSQPAQSLRWLALALAIALVVALSGIPVWAQSAVAPSARQAVASGLAPHPTAQQRARPVGKLLGSSRSYGARPLPQDNMYYANGPVNGLCDINDCTVDAWTLNFGYAATNSFPGATTSGFQFAVWAYPGDVLQTIDYSIDATPFGGTPTTVGVSSVFQYSNQYGYDIDVVTVSGLNASLGSGTYWLTLQNAVTTQGNPIYWDENGGPSQAQESSLGTIPSESFNIEGAVGAHCADDESMQSQTVSTRDLSADGPQLVYGFYHFQGGTDGSYPVTGVTLDQEDNIYGTTSQGCGTLFRTRLSYGGSKLETLYTFQGGNDGCNLASSMVFGPDGVLYGTTAQGGVAGGGTVYGLAPQPTVCKNALCPWVETVKYSFQGGADGYTPGGGQVAFDPAGNLYDSVLSGGAYGNGAIYKLTRSGVGWAKTSVYDFQGGTDGSNPNGGVILDAQGNLYGTTINGGAYGYGTVFELVPVGGGWTETILHNFTSVDGTYPAAGLAMDSSGNLYGATPSGGTLGGGTVFMLAPSGGSWTFTVAYDFDPNIDGAGPSSTLGMGNGWLFGTAIQYGCSLGKGLQRSGSCRLPQGGAGTLFAVGYRDGQWWYSLMNQFEWGDKDGAFPFGSVVYDNLSGFVFGTTWGGGDGCGVVYQGD